MGSLFDTIYDVLFQPQIGMRGIAERKNVGQAFVTFSLSVLLPIWALYFGLKAAGMTTMINMMIGFKIVGSMVMWIMGAAIWHLIAEFFGGQGTAKGLLAALGFAHIPRIFIVPLWALTAVMPDGSKTAVMAVSILAVMFWILYLDVVAIKEVHQLSRTKAVLVLIMPWLFLGLLCAIVFAFIGSSITQLPMWL
ncbi:MAG: YIP1 family protein [Sporomusaceae bacterium]|nr:YIP1 family protein [Sporomusaceae bacterium]